MSYPTSPLSVPNNLIWLDSADLTTLWQDSGKVSAVTTTGQTVGYWADKSGNGLDFNQATSGNRPTWSTALFPKGAVTFLASSVQSLICAISGAKPAIFDTLQNGSYTFSFVCYPQTAIPNFGTLLAKASNTDAPIWFSTAAGGNGVGFTRWSYCFSTGNNNNPAGALLPNNAFLLTYKWTLFQFETISGTPAAFGEEAMYINGQKVMSQVHQMTVWNTAASLRIGATDTPGFEFNGAIPEIVAYNRAISETERQQVESYLAQKWSIRYAASERAPSRWDVTTPQRMNIVGCGNSLLFGVNAYGGDFLNQCHAAFPYPANWLNYGIPGIATTALINTRPAKEDSFLRPGANNVLFCWELTNEISGLSISAAQAYANMKTLCAAAKAVGWQQVIILTCLPRNAAFFGGQTGAGFETARQAVNASLRGDFTVASGIANVYKASPARPTAIGCSMWARTPTSGPSRHSAGRTTRATASTSVMPDRGSSPTATHYLCSSRSRWPTR